MRAFALSAFFMLVFAACSPMHEFHGSDEDLSSALKGTWLVDETPEDLKGNKSAAQLSSKYVFSTDGVLTVVSMNSHMPPTTYRGTWAVTESVLRVSAISDENKKWKLVESYKVSSIGARSFVAVMSSNHEQVVFKRAE